MSKNKTDDATTTTSGTNGRSKSAELVQRIMAGDHTAETEAWQRYLTDMKKTAWRYSQCRYDVDDRISMSWEIALPKLRAGELQLRDRLRSYMCGIVRSVSLGEIRRRPWLSVTDDRYVLEQTLIDPDTPCDVLERQVAVERTVEMIDLLPIERDRDVLKQEYFDDMSRSAMCQRHAASPLQMSRLISRARTRLRASVTDWETLGL